MKTIDIVRQTGRHVLLMILAANVLIVPGIALIVAPDKALTVFLVLGLGTLGAFLLMRFGGASRWNDSILAVTLVSAPAANLYVFAGHPWQVDMHMVFFATLGVSALLVDARAVLASAAAVAVHHLSFNFVLPALVFPGGSDVVRVLVHAAIVVWETAALFWLCVKLEATISDADNKRHEAEEQSRRIEEMTRETVERERQQQEKELARQKAEEEAATAAREEKRRQEEALRQREAEESRRVERAQAEERERQQKEAMRLAEEERSRALREMSDAFLTVVTAARHGDFEKRIEPAGSSGALRQLGDQMNALLETVVEGVEETARVLNALATADLTVRSQGQFEGIFEELANGANATADQLSVIITELQRASTALANASGEIKTGADELATRAVDQADALEATERSVSELRTQIGNQAEVANRARQSLDQINGQTAVGSEAMEEAATAIANIETSSKSVADILGTIEDISFQTTLLSLNASVEAARAGEAGRGFAVVADEIRSLANTTKEASSKIRELVGLSAKDVEAGVASIERAHQNFNDIRTNLAGAGEMVVDIAESCAEQVERLRSLNRTFKQLNDITQSNAALAEETQAATGEMTKLVATFDRTANRFRVTGTERPVLTQQVA